MGDLSEEWIVGKPHVFRLLEWFDSIRTLCSVEEQTGWASKVHSHLARLKRQAAREDEWTTATMGRAGAGGRLRTGRHGTGGASYYTTTHDSRKGREARVSDYSSR